VQSSSFLHERLGKSPQLQGKEAAEGACGALKAYGADREKSVKSLDPNKKGNVFHTRKPGKGQRESVRVPQLALPAQ